MGVDIEKSVHDVAGFAKSISMKASSDDGLAGAEGTQLGRWSFAYEVNRRRVKHGVLGCRSGRLWKQYAKDSKLTALLVDVPKPGRMTETRDVDANSEPNHGRSDGCRRCRADYAAGRCCGGHRNQGFQ